jgi:hypothetical protein
MKFWLTSVKTLSNCENPSSKLFRKQRMILKRVTVSLFKITDGDCPCRHFQSLIEVPHSL